MRFEQFNVLLLAEIHSFTTIDVFMLILDFFMVKFDKNH